MKSEKSLIQKVNDIRRAEKLLFDTALSKPLLELVSVGTFLVSGFILFLHWSTQGIRIAGISVMILAVTAYYFSDWLYNYRIKKLVSYFKDPDYNEAYKVATKLTPDEMLTEVQKKVENEYGGLDYDSFIS